MILEDMLFKLHVLEPAAVEKVDKYNVKAKSASIKWNKLLGYADSIVVNVSDQQVIQSLQEFDQR